MGNDGMSAGLGLRHKIVVGDLKKGAHRRRRIGLTVCPGADGRQCRKDQCIRREKETAASLCRPLGQLVCNGLYLVSHLLDAEEYPGRIPGNEPFPEGRTEIEPVVKVLRGDEDVCVQQIGHQYSTPRLRPSSLKVAIFLRPSMRKVSVYPVRPSSVLATTARAKRLLTLAPSVR